MTTKQVSKHLENYLKISSAIFLIVSVFAIISAKFNIPLYISSCGSRHFSEAYFDCIVSVALALFHKQPHALVLAAFTFGWYFLYRSAVENEKKILDEILASSFNDRDQNTLKDEIMIIFLAVALPILFLVLAWTVDMIEIYCFIVICLNAADLIGNTIIRENLERLLKSAEEVSIPESHRNIFRAKRKIARWYWIELPQLKRVCGHLMINLIALFVAINPETRLNIDIDPNDAYVILCLGIILNELTMFIWRRKRNRKLTGIAHLQARSIHAAHN